MHYVPTVLFLFRSACCHPYHHCHRCSVPSSHIFSRICSIIEHDCRLKLIISNACHLLSSSASTIAVAAVTSASLNNATNDDAYVCTLACGIHGIIIQDHIIVPCLRVVDCCIQYSRCFNIALSSSSLLPPHSTTNRTRYFLSSLSWERRIPTIDLFRLLLVF